MKGRKFDPKELLPRWLHAALALGGEIVRGDLRFSLRAASSPGRCRWLLTVRRRLQAGAGDSAPTRAWGPPGDCGKAAVPGAGRLN